MTPGTGGEGAHDEHGVFYVPKGSGVLSDPVYGVHKDMRHAARIRAVMDFLVEQTEAQSNVLLGKSVK